MEPTKSVCKGMISVPQELPLSNCEHKQERRLYTAKRGGVTNVSKENSDEIGNEQIKRTRSQGPKSRTQRPTGDETMPMVDFPSSEIHGEQGDFVYLVADGIPAHPLHPSHLARLLKKNTSVPLFVWHKQAQELRKKEDGTNAIKLFKHNVAQGLTPGCETIAMLFSTIEAAGERVSLTEAAEIADLVRKTHAHLSENSLFGMLRLYCLQRTQQGFDNAMHVLNEIKSQCKVLLRDYTPLFSTLRHLGTPTHLDLAFSLLAEVKASKYDTLECQFLDVLTLATQLRVSPPDKVYNMLMDFNEVIFRPSPMMLSVLEQWFLFQCESSNCPVPSKGVVSAEGICTRCSRMLRSIDLTDEEFDLMLEQINVLLEQGGKKANKNLDRVSPFQAFTKWLKVNGPFDVVIDGANVGYYQWRPRDGDDILNYDHIDQIWDYWRREGKRVLVILHERHLDPDKVARLPKYGFQGIVEKLKASHSLYLTPKGSNDDWYWLYAGLTGTRFNRRMFMITNDQMRDHHFATLSTRHFVKWRGRHMVRYGFEGREPTFRLPAMISFQSQVDREEKFSHWHFPAASLSADLTEAPAATAARALATTVSNDVEDLGKVEWLCTQNVNVT